MKILLAVDGSRYSDAEAGLVAGITWPAGTTTRVLAVVPERLPLIGIGPDAQRMVDETPVDIRQQEWVAAEAIAVRAAGPAPPAFAWAARLKKSSNTRRVRCWWYGKREDRK